MTDKTTLSVTLPQDLLLALDRYAAQRDLSPDHAQVLVHALRDWAINEGLMSPGSGDDGMRPEELSAANDD